MMTGVNLKDREKHLAVIAGTIVAASVFFHQFVLPVAKTSRRLALQIDAVEKKLSTYRGLIKNEDKVREQFNSTFSSIPMVSASKEDSLVTVLSEVERLAQDSQVQIIDIRPQGFQGGTALYKEAFIEVRTQAALPAYIAFIYKIEHSLSLLRVKKFQLAVRSDSQLLDGTVTLSLLAATR